MDQVDLDLPVITVVESFGRFLKYLVEEQNEMDGASCNSTASRRNAFDVLMNSQWGMIKYCHLVRGWSRRCVTHFGISMAMKMYSLVDHQPYPVRLHLSKATINCSEKAKHRKRQHGNLSRDQLNTMATELAVLLSNAWEREYWSSFKEDVAGLARALAGYTEYLTQKNKIMKIHHASATPVRELSNHLRVEFLAKSTSLLTPTSLVSIEEALYPKSKFEYTSITNILPSDPLKKHRSVEFLTANGLRFPSVFIYSPGSNIGNLHFLWKVPEECGSCCCI